MKKVRGYKGIYTVDRVKTGKTFYASFRERKTAIIPKPVKVKTNKITYSQLLDLYQIQRLFEEQDPKQTKENVKQY